VAEPLTYRLDHDVAVLTLDDGKANAIGHGTIDALDGALDRAESEARAVVITGRPGRFSAGFDLSVMTESTEAMRGLVLSGARLFMRLYGYRLPTVAACTGHALAAGALVLLSCDRRIGADGSAKIGLNEVAIGMGLPVFAVELARERLQPSQFTAATMAARVYDPAGAVDAGYLDTVVPEFDLLTTALAEARALGELQTGAYAHTKTIARRAKIAEVLSSLEDDLATISGPNPR
jgi:enoyl-CoA hydratase